MSSDPTANPELVELLEALGGDNEIELRNQALALEEELRRSGAWDGGAKPLVEYQQRPIDFAVEKMGVRRNTLVWSENPGYENHRWDGTPDPIVVIAESLAAGKDVAVESATATGKSHAIGWLEMWFLASWLGARCFSFAAKEEQLTLYSWMEKKKLWPQFRTLFPSADLTHLRLRITGGDDEGEFAGWAAYGRAAGVGADEEIAAKAAGMHAPHMLIVVEEAQGVALPVSRAIEHTSTGVHNLRLYVGNPDNQQDALHQFSQEPGVVLVRISALDHPNIVVNVARDPKWEDVVNDVEIIPGAASRKTVLRRRKRYGEGDPMYQSRVRGISPAQSAHSIIKREWCEASARLYDDPDLREGLPALGVDVAASATGDYAAIASGIGACCLEVQKLRCEDPNQLGREIFSLMEAGDPKILARNVGVDADTWGAGTANELKRLGKRVRALRSASKAFRRQDYADVWEAEPSEDESDETRRVVQEEVFQNLRAQMWWTARLDLQHGRVAIPQDDELFDDLTAVRRLPKQVIQIEDKDGIRARLGRSPDKGEAFVYWNWVRSRRRVRVEPEAKVDPNEDVEFDEFWERLVEAHEGRTGHRSKKVARRVGAIRRRA